MRKILICGMGLLGGSLAKKIAANGQYRLRVWSRSSASLAAAAEWGVPVAAELQEALADADLIVLCMPIPATIDFLKEHANAFAPGAVVTDIGSLKQEVMACAPLLESSGAWLIGSHPMAGTEKSGFANSFASLYDNCDVFVTPPGACPEAALAEVSSFWKSVGGTVRRIDAATHDALVARTSHLLHVLASALTLSILSGRGEADKLLHFAGCAT
ncbi:MAG: prephenate dehydrogenase, partial [Victivallaceae bacterium]|nr:prephenate dehydrogenase [Victivallaceae bacterium]